MLILELELVSLEECLPKKLKEFAVGSGSLRPSS